MKYDHEASRPCVAGVCLMGSHVSDFPAALAATLCWKFTTATHRSGDGVTGVVERLHPAPNRERDGSGEANDSPLPRALLVLA